MYCDWCSILFLFVTYSVVLLVATLCVSRKCCFVRNGDYTWPNWTKKKKTLKRVLFFKVKSKSGSIPVRLLRSSRRGVLTVPSRDWPGSCCDAMNTNRSDCCCLPSFLIKRSLFSPFFYNWWCITIRFTSSPDPRGIVRPDYTAHQKKYYNTPTTQSSRIGPSINKLEQVQRIILFPIGYKERIKMDEIVWKKKKLNNRRATIKVYNGLMPL